MKASLLMAPVLVLAACAGGDSSSSGPAPASPVALLVRQFPVIADLVSQAARRPALAEGAGAGSRYVLTSAEPTALKDGSRWQSLSHSLSMTVDATGAMRLGTGGMGGIGVARLGDVQGHPVADHGGIACGTGIGAPGAYLFATDHGVEDLLLVRDATARVGYRFELPDGWRLIAPPAYPGLIEVRDESDVSRVRIRTGKAWDAGGHEVAVAAHVAGREVEWTVEGSTGAPVVIDPTFDDAGSMLLDRSDHTATLLPTGKVLIAGGNVGFGALTKISESTELYDPRTGAFTAARAMTQPRAGHSATLLQMGAVLIAGGAGAGGSSTTELFDPATGTFTPAPSMLQPRGYHTATLLPNRKVLVAGGTSVPEAAELYDPDGNTFSLTGTMVRGRAFHTATLLPGGGVLIAGGEESLGTPLKSAELYDPVGNEFTAVGSMTAARSHHTATLLPDGGVLVAGTGDGTADSASTEVYRNGRFTSTGSAMTQARGDHTATLLPDGKVLLAGGHGDAAPSAEVYDPAADTFTPANGMTLTRAAPSATLLPSGRVLIAGGRQTAYAPYGSAALYDPASVTLAVKGALTQARRGHTATELCTDARGRRAGRPTVLITGGDRFGDGIDGSATAELYDPDTDTSVPTGAMTEPRYLHTATLLEDCKVLIAGGDGATSGSDALRSAEIYDPKTGTFAATQDRLLQAREYHTATLLPGGGVLIAGGAGGGDSITPLKSAELYKGGHFNLLGDMNHAREYHTATLLGGRVLIAGGRGTNGSLAAREVYDPATGFTRTEQQMTDARESHTATFLPPSSAHPEGAVLITGGLGTTAEIYDPGKDAFTLTVSMNQARQGHAAVLLGDGRALITGGTDAFGHPVTDAEVYAPPSSSFASAGPMIRGHIFHTATTLSGGKILVAGGVDLNTSTSNGGSLTEIYHPLTRTFTTSIEDRGPHTTTLLSDGTVLIAGGLGDLVDRKVFPPRIYDPASRTLMDTTPMHQERSSHAATLLPSGRVLILGGDGRGDSVIARVLASAELYDPVSGKFTAAGEMKAARSSPTATLLPSGKVLIAGGRDANGPLTTAELYDPAGKGTFALTGGMNRPRWSHAATLLPSGKVLIAGGRDASNVDETSVELYDPTTETFTLSPLSFGALAGGTLASGDALLASSSGGAEIGRDGSELATRRGVPGSIAVIPLANGDAVIVGSGDTLWVPAGSRAPGTLRGAPGLLSATRLASGELFGYFGGTLRGDPRPSGVLPPTISGTPEMAKIVSGSTVTLTGTRFSSPTAVGSAALPADPSHLPLVAFMPAAATGGGPIFGRTTHWSDTELTWEVPRTVFRGPGFLHVYVEGVWSDGAYTVLAGETQGNNCSLDAECSTDHCVEGLCCDRTCAGGCETCRAETQAPGGTDGTCKPIAKAATPRFGCEHTDNVCSPTGKCDGTGNCTLPTQATQCLLPGGKQGACFGGTCAAVSCTSAAECPPGNRCSVDHRCVPAVVPAVATDSGACSVVRTAPSRRGQGPWERLAATALLVTALRRTRRRSTRRVPAEDARGAEG
jgi:hypothetical protein